jgi:hypothetical protein
MSLSCVSDIKYEIEFGLEPSFRQMKLHGSYTLKDKREIINPRKLLLNNPKEILKSICPSFSEEVKNLIYILKKIKFVLEKASNDLELAKKLVYEIKVEEKMHNKNRINLHKQNRKRKFDQIENFDIPSICEQSNIENININRNNNEFEYIKQNEIEIIFEEIKEVQNKEKYKIYLKEKIIDLISKFYLILIKIDSRIKINQLLKPSLTLKKNEEIKMNYNNLLTDNEKIKKIIKVLQKKCNVYK